MTRKYKYIGSKHVPAVDFNYGKKGKEIREEKI